MKRIIGLILLIGIMTGCTSVKTISGTSKDFNKDVYKLIQDIEKDIEKQSNQTSTIIPGSKGYEFLKKYDNENANLHESKVISILKKAISLRESNFISIGDTLPKYNTMWDEMCLEEIEKIKEME